jgi:hypothetical protein
VLERARVIRRTSAGAAAAIGGGVARRFMRLPRSERRLALGAALLMGGIRIALAIAPLRVVRRLLAVDRERRSHRSRIRRGAADAHAVARAVTRAGAVLPGATCLVRALALHRMLGRRGHRARLLIGFERSASGPVAGHAWVESAGAVFGMSGEGSRYAPAVRPVGSRR